MRKKRFLADRTNGRAYHCAGRRLSSVTLSIVAKLCVLEQKLLLTAYSKSYVLYKKSIDRYQNEWRSTIASHSPL